MTRPWTIRAGTTALALALLGFVFLGFARVVFPVETARTVASPLIFAAFVAAVGTFLLALGDRVRGVLR